MFPINEQFLIVGEGSLSAQAIVIQDRLELLLVGLQFREASLSQRHLILTGDRIEIGITKEEIWKLFQYSIFQFRWRNGRRWKRWNGRRRFRCWRWAFCRRWTRCLCYDGAYHGSHFEGRGPDRCRFPTRRDDRRTCREKHRQNNHEGTNSFHTCLLILRTFAQNKMFPFTIL